LSNFSGKVAIITGGAGGLGGATARLLASRGAHVVVTDLTEATGEALAKEIGGTFVRHDVANPGQWDLVVSTALKQTGNIDILINAAGVEGDFNKGGLATDLAEWRSVMSVNLDGTFLGCRAVMPSMLAAGKGAIVNFSSIVAFMGTPTALAYGASKAGVEQLSRSLALMGAQDGKKVRCNAIHPGVIRTRMTDNIFASFAAAQGITAAEAEAGLCASIPLGARGEPQDVAHTVAFLVSDEARYITGASIRVDGGWSVTSAG
jgi:NAD(P)-dependent dehydrogenase (short-subunit alcohol dehydrogenase family)